MDKESLQYNYQKIAQYIVDNYNEGEILSYREIVDGVFERYRINKDSILPSDYCDNHNNLDPHAGIYYIFHRVGRGQYKVLNHDVIKESCNIK